MDNVTPDMQNLPCLSHGERTIADYMNFSTEPSLRTGGYFFDTTGLDSRISLEAKNGQQYFYTERDSDADDGYRVKKVNLGTDFSFLGDECKIRTVIKAISTQVTKAIICKRAGVTEPPLYEFFQPPEFIRQVLVSEAMLKALEGRANTTLYEVSRMSETNIEEIRKNCLADLAPKKAAQGGVASPATGADVPPTAAATVAPASATPANTVAAGGATAAAEKVANAPITRPNDPALQKPFDLFAALCGGKWSNALETTSALKGEADIAAMEGLAEHCNINVEVLSSAFGAAKTAAEQAMKAAHAARFDYSIEMYSPNAVPKAARPQIAAAIKSIFTEASHTELFEHFAAAGRGAAARP